MLKTVTTSAGSENPFSVLSEKKDDSAEDGTEDELIINAKGGTSKRKSKTKKKSNSDKSRSSTLPQQGSEKFNKAFPGVSSIKTSPKDPTNPAAVVPQKDHGKDNRTPLSILFEAVLSAVSGSTRTLLEPLIPFFKELGKILSENSALNAIISYD
ncbi:conserved hypothetical protein [Culex quinquefasciatus]|uniref:Uncharacterized protein n=1 Tax=Culex quinquefasciatus TaxID=7176 RepID=B0X080_CULQU|nr:conserved hypothetical protein [Culex quinquefasciatus]|eukprot:XP_001863052.1 conserved hypothetical protein [Culex quinquefasciatus]